MLNRQEELEIKLSALYKNINKALEFDDLDANYKQNLLASKKELVVAIKKIRNAKNIISPDDLPPKYIKLINRLVKNESERPTVIREVEKVYLNIENQQDKKLKNLAAHVLNEVLKEKGGAFTQADYHAEYQKLFGSNITTGGGVNEEETFLSEKKISLVLDLAKLIQKNKDKDSPKNVSITPIGTVEISIVFDDSYTLKFQKDPTTLFKNSTSFNFLGSTFQPFQNTLRRALINIEKPVKNFAGYEWLELTWAMETISTESSVKLIDPELSLVSGKVELTGAMPNDILLSFLNIINEAHLESNKVAVDKKLIVISVKAGISFDVKLGLQSQITLKEIAKLHEKNKKIIKNIGQILKKVDKQLVKEREYRKDLKRLAKNKRTSSSSRFKVNKRIDELKKLTKNSEAFRGELKGRFLDLTEKVKVNEKIIQELEGKLSKLAKPLAQKAAKLAGKAALKIALKFIPGVNIISTMYDVYEIGNVLLPILWEAVFKKHEGEENQNQQQEPNMSDRVRAYFKYLDKEEIALHLTQEQADRYSKFFESFDKEAFENFKNRVKETDKEMEGVDVNQYLDKLEEYKNKMNKGDWGESEEIQHDRNTQSITAVLVKDENNIKFNEDKTELTAELVFTLTKGDNRRIIQKVEYLVERVDNDVYYLRCKYTTILNTNDDHQWALEKGRKAVYQPKLREDEWEDGIWEN